jgi:transcriptional/translational regulatory protein YebC/TACO1
VVLTKDEEQEPQLNRSLFLAMKKFNQITVPEEMFEAASDMATSAMAKSAPLIVVKTKYIERADIPHAQH